MTEHLGFGWPTCAICNKPVERVTSTEDKWLERVTFTVGCHGATEIVTVDFHELARGARFGEAFRGPKALPP